MNEDDKDKLINLSTNISADEAGELSIVGDFLKMMKGMLDAPGKPLALDDADGVVVSTIVSTDMGPETAVLDAVTAYPVERYVDEETALAGHERWVAMIKAHRPPEIRELGYGWFVEAEIQPLVYDRKWSEEFVREKKAKEAKEGEDDD